MLGRLLSFWDGLFSGSPQTKWNRLFSGANLLSVSGELTRFLWRVRNSYILHLHIPSSQGLPKMGPPYRKRDPYHSHILRDSYMGVGLGNSMGKGSHYWGSLKIPSFHHSGNPNTQAIPPAGRAWHLALTLPQFSFRKIPKELIPSLKLIAKACQSTWKMLLGKRSFPFGAISAYFQTRSVSFREGKQQQQKPISNDWYVQLHPRKPT